MFSVMPWGVDSKALGISPPVALNGAFGITGGRDLTKPWAIPAPSEGEESSWPWPRVMCLEIREFPLPLPPSNPKAHPILPRWR